MAEMTKLGWNDELGGWITPWFCDMHVHFRFADEMMRLVIPFTARHNRFATTMPNFGKDRIRTPDQVVAYRKRVLPIAHQVNPIFDATVPFYFEPNTDPRVVEEGFDQGVWRCGKLYSRGATTGSEDGVDFRELARLRPVFRIMAERRGLVPVHCEPTHYRDGGKIVPRKREQEGIQYIEQLLEWEPTLIILVEHVSSAAMIAAIRRLRKAGHHVFATVAPQYLVWNFGQVVDNGIAPAWHSHPILKDEEDRQEIDRATTTEDWLFAGSDSAPHDEEAKSNPCGCSAGVFNAPVSEHVYFDCFRKSGQAKWFENFLEFACYRGPRVYGLPVDETPALLIRERPTRIAARYTLGDTTLIPMYAGEEVATTIERLPQAA